MQCVNKLFNEEFRGDQMGDNALAFFRQAVVFPPERNDLKINVNTGHGCQAAGTAFPTGNQISGGDPVWAWARFDGDPGARLFDLPDLVAGEDGTACGLEQLSRPGRDLPVIRYSGGRQFERTKPDDPGFDTSQFSLGPGISDRIFRHRPHHCTWPPRAEIFHSPGSVPGPLGSPGNQ